MTSKKKSSSLLIITEHFYPSHGATAQLLVDLADGLATQGIKVTVLTSTPGASRADYRTYRTPQIAFRYTSIISKLFKGLSFLCFALYFLIFNREASFDKVLIASNPPFIALLIPLSKLFSRKDYYFLQQDLFPHSATLAGIVPSSGPLKSALDALMHVSYISTTKTIVLNNSMHRLLKSRHNIDPVVIHNWAVEASEAILSPNPLVKEWDLENKFIIQYSGNFGRLHEILTILEASRLVHDKSICFLFIGRGSKLDQIQAYKHNYSADNIVLKNYVSRQYLPYSLSMAHISLVSLIPGADDAVAPSKLYGILASGKPVIYIGSESSDISKLIYQYDCGYSIRPGDCVQLAEAITKAKLSNERLKLMGENSRRLYNERFDFDKALCSYMTTLNLT